MLKRFIVLGWFLAALVIVLSCGPSPMGETPTTWECRLEIPRDYAFARGFAICEGDLYLNAYIPQGDSRDVILKYDGRNLSISYDPSRTLGGNAWIYDVYSLGNEVWACGCVYIRGYGTKYKYEPFLAQYKNGRWLEVYKGTTICRGINRVMPIRPNTCWILVDKLGSGRSYTLAKYENGEITDYPAAGKLDELYYDPPSGYIYAVGTSGWIVSADEGKTWYPENIDPTAFGYVFERILGVCARTDTLYLTTRYQGLVFGIIERSGPPGNGECRPVFVEVNDPVFLELNAIAFDDRDRGIAAGHNSSVLYENGTWRKETMEEEVNFLELVADPRGGFWGLSNNFFSGPAGVHIYYHP